MADTKVSALTAATAAAGTNELPINESGTSKKLTVTQLATFMFTSGANDPGSFTIATEHFVAMVRRLTLTTTERATLVGTARLRID